MRWREDLVRDIRFGDKRDDDDYPMSGAAHPVEFTECNRASLRESFLSIKDCRSILEIGVCRNGEESSTYVFTNLKKSSAVYLGVDIEDKGFLDDLESNVHTIMRDSSRVDEVMSRMEELTGERSIDYLFIDGWHSINQVLSDWEYTAYLSDGGIVGFHDTVRHPGPSRFVDALDRRAWRVSNLCRDDNGISFVTRNSCD